MQVCFSEEEFNLCCKQAHEEQLQRLERAPNKFLKEYYLKLFGVNQRSHLEEAPFFDVCEQFPQDIMHVFSEGILAYEFKYLLKYYVKEESIFNLQDLIGEIRKYPCRYSQIKNKPYFIKATVLD